jgi:hypothetical protein
MEEIYSLKIYYLNNTIEFFLGIIDYAKRVIKIIELGENRENKENEEIVNYKEKGFINFDAIKKVDILKKIEIEK